VFKMGGCCGGIWRSCWCDCCKKHQDLDKRDGSRHGCGTCLTKCCGWTEPDSFHDKVTHTTYEQQIYENQQPMREEAEAKRKELLKYLAKREGLKDGDVIAFVGHTFTDGVISAVTGGEYGHVAVVCSSLWEEETRGSLHGDALVLESFASHHGKPVLDALKNEIRSGTQAHILWKRLEVLQNDSVYVHRLKTPLNEEETKNFQEFCQRAHKEAAEYDYSQAYGIAARRATHDKSFRDSQMTTEEENHYNYFCSELVACALQAAGRLDKELNCSLVVPGDFACKEQGTENSRLFAHGEIVGEAELLVEAMHPPMEPMIMIDIKDQRIKQLEVEVASLKSIHLEDGDSGCL